MHRIGDKYYKKGTKELSILAITGPAKPKQPKDLAKSTVAVAIALIDLKTGNRWKDPVFEYVEFTSTGQWISDEAFKKACGTEEYVHIHFLPKTIDELDQRINEEIKFLTKGV